MRKRACGELGVLRSDTLPVDNLDHVIQVFHNQSNLFLYEAGPRLIRLDDDSPAESENVWALESKKSKR
jgi:hypothetical protein